MFYDETQNDLQIGAFYTVHHRSRGIFVAEMLTVTAAYASLVVCGDDGDLPDGHRLTVARRLATFHLQPKKSLGTVVHRGGLVSHDIDDAFEETEDP